MASSAAICMNHPQLVDMLNKNIFRIARLAFALLASFASQSALAEKPASACLSPAAWTAPAQKAVRSATEVITSLAKRDVVLLGEYHDEDDHHRWQVHTLAALHALRPNMVIGFEMFPRRVQPALDRWVAGELTLKQFLEQSEWDKVWNAPADLYLPLFQFARINRIPMVALNVDNALNKVVREKGWDNVPPAQREGVGKPAAPPAAYLDFLFDVYGMHGVPHGEKDSKADKKTKPSRSDSGFRNFVDSQTLWDRAMAEALARHALPAAPDGKPLVVGIIGAAHLRFGHGVPHQLRDLGVKDIGIALAMPVDTDCKELVPDLADAVFGLPPQPAEPIPPPRLGVRLEEKDGAVQLTEITAGSLAESTGFKVGDRLLEIGGVAAVKTSQVAATIRRQPAGTWLPVKLQRGDDTLDIVIKFPVKS